jgi:hypothetical protein
MPLRARIGKGLPESEGTRREREGWVNGERRAGVNGMEMEGKRGIASRGWSRVQYTEVAPEWGLPQPQPPRPQGAQLRRILSCACRLLREVDCVEHH